MPATEPLRPHDPTRLGGFRLVGRLGEGGQGTVFLAEPEHEDEAGADAPAQVAVKLLHGRLNADPRARTNFARELAAAQQVDPFCTARILAADVEGDLPYIVSEFIDGPSLREVVETAGPRSGTALDRLAIGTATALTAIHGAGVVHRDFKPGNVILGPDGPRVIDFGVARAVDAHLSVTSQVVGTPAYMAPEQVSGESPGMATDLFAWAGTIAYTASGRPPFGQDYIPAVINRILHDEPDLDGLGGGLLAELVLACLNKDPRQRPTARAVLLRLLGHEDVTRVVVEEVVQEEAPEEAADRLGTAAVLEEGAAAAAPKRRRRRSRTVLWSVVGPAVLAAAATAAAIVFMFWPQPGATTAGPSDPSAAVSSSANLEGRTWLHGKLGLRLKKGWKVVDRSESAKYVVTGEGCDGKTDACPGFLVLGPSAVAQARELGPYDGKHPYHPSTGTGPCRVDARLVQGAAARLTSGTAPVADRTAAFRSWKVGCVRGTAKAVEATYRQREWFLPQSQILIVAWWDGVHPEDVLAGAQWRG